MLAHHVFWHRVTTSQGTRHGSLWANDELVDGLMGRQKGRTAPEGALDWSKGAQGCLVHRLVTAEGRFPAFLAAHHSPGTLLAHVGVEGPQGNPARPALLTPDSRLGQEVAPSTIEAGQPTRGLLVERVLLRPVVRQKLLLRLLLLLLLLLQLLLLQLDGSR